jgi:glutathione S-transferase
MNENPIELHQFSLSHYNEKVRWTLDYKGIAHVRICYIPGPHIPYIRRLTGQTETPVLRIDGQAVHGSATIIDLLERRFPAPALYPADPAARDEALAVQARLDAELGAEVRRAMFETTLDHPAFVAASFASEKPRWKRRLWEATFPATRAIMKKAMDISPETARLSRERVAGMLDWLAEKSAATGYLVGDGFTIADLTGAALLGPVMLVDHPDMRKPEPRPPRYSALCAEWADHPAMRWAHAIWSKHRPPRRGVVIA